MCVGCMLFFLPFLLPTNDSLDVQVHGVEYDGASIALEHILPLDLHAGSLLLLIICILWDRLLQDFLQNVM